MTTLSDLDKKRLLVQAMGKKIKGETSRLGGEGEGDRRKPTSTPSMVPERAAQLSGGAGETVIRAKSPTPTEAPKMVVLDRDGLEVDLMATKAQTFRYLAERSGPDRASKPKKRRDAATDTSKPGVSATDRKAGGGSSAARNRSLHAARKGGVKLEDSQTTPSRKSTRRSKGRTVSPAWSEEGIETKRHGEGRVKPAANLRIRAAPRTRSPKQRSQRGR